jgi:hypothetical protein
MLIHETVKGIYLLIQSAAIKKDKEFAKKVKDPAGKEKTLHILLEQYTDRNNPRREFFRVSPEEVRTFFDLMDGEMWAENHVKPEEEEESVWSEDDSENEDPPEQFTDYALQGSRWMFQREEGEEIDPEEAESENDSIEENEETWTEVEEDDEPVAEVEEIVSKLQQRGITMVDIIAMFLERKSKNVRKHNPRFFAALDVMIDDITYECDMDVKERASSNNVQTETA